MQRQEGVVAMTAPDDPRQPRPELRDVTSAGDEAVTHAVDSFRRKLTSKLNERGDADVAAGRRPEQTAEMVHQTAAQLYENSDEQGKSARRMTLARI